MNIKNCVYRFINNEGEIIYIGKAKNLIKRLNGHNHLPKECYEEIQKIEYCTFANEYEMDFAERYFIPKFHTKYNEILNDKEMSIEIDNLDKKEWLEYNKDKIKEERKREKELKKQREKEARREERRREKEAKLSEKELEKIRKKEAERQKILKMIQEEERKRKEEYEKKLNKKIIDIISWDIYENVHEAAKDYFISEDEIIKQCDKYYFLGLEHPIYETSVIFEYYDDFLKNHNRDSKEHYIDISKVICLTTGEIYNSIDSASKKTRITRCHIKSCCKRMASGKLASAGKLEDGTLIRWMFYDDYLKLSKENIEQINKNIEAKKGIKIMNGYF